MRVLVIPDVHAPYHHKLTLRFLDWLANQGKINGVVDIGDLGDGHGWSRHGRLPDSLGQAEELARCRAFCRKLYEMFPVAYACVGNHDTRLGKLAMRAGIPSALHADIAEIYQSPAGWKWDYSHKIDGVLYSHGDNAKGLDPAWYSATMNRCSTVIGHYHARAGIKWGANADGPMFAMSAGCLIDADSPGMAYARNTLARPVLGAGLVIDGAPRFVSLREFVARKRRRVVAV